MPHPSTSSAYGIWSLNEVRDAERGDNWPSLPIPTFDPDNLGSSITLSNNNLTATVGSGTSLAPCNVFKSSGQWYCEFTVDVSSRLQIGIYKEGASVEVYMGDIVDGTLGFEPSQDRKFFNNVQTDPFFGQTYSEAVGTVHALALDLDAGTLDYYFNGSLVGELESGLSGSYTFAVGDILNAGSLSVTANFGSTAFSYTPPSGYTGFVN